jgi:hypothetical protein
MPGTRGQQTQHDYLQRQRGPQLAIERGGGHTRATIAVTNSRLPTGGVTMPSGRLTMKTMAKCSGSTPSAARGAC